MVSQNWWTWVWASDSHKESDTTEQLIWTELLAPTLFSIKAFHLVALIRALFYLLDSWASLVTQRGKNQPTLQKTRVRSLGCEGPLEEGMATHSSVLTWRISHTEEPGGLQSLGSQRVRHDWVTKHTHTSLNNTNHVFKFTQLNFVFNQYFSSVTQSCPTLQRHGLQHARLPCPSPVSRVRSNSCASSRWC